MGAASAKQRRRGDQIFEHGSSLFTRTAFRKKTLDQQKARPSVGLHFLTDV